ncbi:hypothetical protein [Helicobacter cinaedi]|nr:hypothetical protein [Helicobacter cinaedi]
MILRIVLQAEPLWQNLDYTTQTTCIRLNLPCFAFNVKLRF